MCGAQISVFHGKVGSFQMPTQSTKTYKGVTRYYHFVAPFGPAPKGKRRPMLPYYKQNPDAQPSIVLVEEGKVPIDLQRTAPQDEDGNTVPSPQGAAA